MKRSTDVVSAEKLAEYISCDADTGRLTWKERPASEFKTGRWTAEQNAARWNSRYAGKPALNSVNKSGYKHGTIKGRTVDAHRVVWALVNGAWPAGELDHIDGCRSNNAVRNLREVSATGNACNKAMLKNNKSGVMGVHKSGQKWAAQIRKHGVVRHLGTYETVQEAAEVRKWAERDMGFPAEHGGRCAAP